MRWRCFFEDEQLTYRELNYRANWRTSAITGRRSGGGHLHGTLLEMVVGLFGILKAGGAYVFLDPAYPKERHLHARRNDCALCC